MDWRLKRDRRRRRYARIATARMRFFPPTTPKSPIYKFNVPATCGKCHRHRTAAFMQSIHGQGISRGNGLSPVCTDCHGIHSIKAHINPNSPVSEQNLSRDIPAPAATRGCGFRRSSACRATGFRVTLTVITGWPRRAARWLRPTAPVATACIIFCLRAIRARPSIAPIWMQPAASATRELRRSLR